jgi:hypothetical protein
MLVHNEVDTLRSRQRVVLLQRLNIFRTGQWTFLLGLNEEILTSWRNSLRFIVYEAVSREGAKTLRREVRKRKRLDLILECLFRGSRHANFE